MSYTLVPYVVDIGKLQSLVGCRDEKVLATILEKSQCDDDGEPHDFDNQGDDGDEEEDVEIGMRKAITDLIMGRPLVESAGYEYGYALEKMCEAIGSRVDNDAWCGIRWEVMEASGADVLLLTSGAPVALPTIDDFPTIGYMTAEQVVTAASECANGINTLAPKGKTIRKTLLQKTLGSLLNVLLKQMIGSHRGPIRIEDLEENIAEYRAWLQSALAQKAGLVFFYY